MKSMKIILSTLMTISACAVAEPIVIRDYGGRASGVPDKAQIAKSVMNTSVKPVAEVPRPRFPMRSSLKPGELNKPQALKNKTLNKNAFFIVGNDERSRDWINENKAYLIKIRAKGLATNIASDDEFKSLVAFAEPLTLDAIPLDELAESLSLRVYPVLITNEEIAQ